MLSQTAATDSTRQLLAVLRAWKAGDFAVRVPTSGNEVARDIGQTLNEVIERNEQMARELERLHTAVGKEGKLGQRMALGEVGGGWRRCVDAVNGLIGDLVMPTTEAGRVIGAVASGDLSQTMTLELHGRPLEGELLRTAQVVNGMVDKAKLLEHKNREVELAKQALEDEAEQIALTCKYRSQFLANMAHELRTPLNSQLILSKMLADNADRNLHPKQVEFARTIYAAGTDLLALINDILDFSKIESGTISVEPSELVFGELRDYLEQSFRHVANQKRLDFAIELHAGLPSSVTTDVLRLQQVLKNLLSNAFKFTEHGRVTLETHVAVGGWSRDHAILERADLVIAFAVSDTGIGIPVDKHRIIFEAFQQAEGTTSRRYGGTGLGLSISREIARILGGELRVHSLPGEGSTFTLYLPRTYVPVGHPSIGRRAIDVVEDMPHANDGDHARQPLTMSSIDDSEQLHGSAAGWPEPRRLVVRELQASPSLQGTTVLVVDDDVRNIFAVTSVLEAHHATIVSAENGRDGLRLLETTKVDIVLMDLMMREMDGYMVMRRIRAEPRFAALPIIAVTAKATEADHESCLQAGASDCIAKPVDQDKLVLLVRAWLSN